jgi:hypothetical protein
MPASCLALQKPASQNLCEMSMLVFAAATQVAEQQQELEGLHSCCDEGPRLAARYRQG